MRTEASLIELVSRVSAKNLNIIPLRSKHQVGDTKQQPEGKYRRNME
jgi:hypothetical protein